MTEEIRPRPGSTWAEARAKAGMKLPAPEFGGPQCGHAMFVAGCQSCAAWASENGVEFARHMARRTPEAEEQITAAREITFDDALRHLAARRSNGAFSAMEKEAMDAWGDPAKEKRVIAALEAQLSDAALSNTPAVREMGTPPKVIQCEHLEITDPAERARLGLPALPVTNAGKLDAMMEAAAIAIHSAPTTCRDCAQRAVCLHCWESDRCPHAECAREAGHAELCLRPDLSVILRRMPQTILTGADHDAWDAFQHAAAALEQHAEAGQKLQADYLAAQARLARAGAKRVRGK